MATRFNPNRCFKTILGVLLGAALGSSAACETDSTEECKAKFIEMVGPCVPVCEAQDPNGVGTDACIRACVAQTHAEPIPSC